MLVDPSRLSGTPFDWIIASLLLVLGAAGLVVFRRIWQGELEDRLERILSPFSRHFRRAVASVIPLSFPGALLTGLLYLTILVAGSSSGASARVALAVANALVLPFLLALLFLFSILLFGRPKFLIPPYLRGNRGWFGEFARSLLKSDG
jgi:hypothetical protein